MNQIPNIEKTNTRELRYCRNCNQMTNHNDTTCLKCGLAKETHNTREIEEINNYLDDKVHKTCQYYVYSDLKDLVANIEVALHHQLQKTREEERERIEKDLDRRLEIQKKVSHSEYEGGYTHALQDVKEAIHSELDQDNK